MKYKLTVSVLALLTCCTLAGCGNEEALDTYKEDMTAFCDNITAENDVIDSIDPTTETAAADLLQSLDKIEQDFITLADMNVPTQFSAVESLADEASAYMTEAVGLYHQAFDGEPISEDYDNLMLLANESYGRAMKRVQYIGDILMGQVPDGDNVQVHYKDEAITE